GDGGDVDRHERAVPGGTLPVDGPGDQLLAGAALAQDQHGDARPRYRLDELVKPLHLGRPADQLLEVELAGQLGPAVDRLAAQGALVDGAADEGEDLLLLEGLGDVVEGAQLHRRHRGADRLDGGDQDDLHVVVEGLDLLQDGDAVDVGQPDVQEHQVDLRRPEGLEGVGCVRGLQDVVLVFQDQAEGIPQAGVVVHDQDDRPDPGGGTVGPVEGHRASTTRRDRADGLYADIRGRVKATPRRPGRPRAPAERPPEPGPRGPGRSPGAPGPFEPLPFPVAFGNMIAVPGPPPGRRRLRPTRAGRLAALAVSLTGCGLSSPQTTLWPRSDFAGQSHSIFLQILWWDVGIFAVVATVLLIAIVRFRERDPAALPAQIRGHARMELAWTIAPAIVLTFIAFPTVGAIFPTQASSAPD